MSIFIADDAEYDVEQFRSLPSVILQHADTFDAGLDLDDADSPGYPFLQCRESYGMLATACALNGSEGEVSIAQLKTANWGFPYTQEDAWAYWSARLFSDRCLALCLPLWVG